MPYLFTTIGVLLVAALGLAWRRLARRSGVKDADLTRPLPGDELIPNPQFIMDRATILPASAAEIWPWIVQLGKDRGGWYVPAWLERFTRGTLLSGSHDVEAQFQRLAVGDFVPDYGPGAPLFKVMALEPARTLVYLTIRQPSVNWTWPEPEAPLPRGALVLSWALLIDEIDGAHCRLYVRLRGKREGLPASWAMVIIGGLIDYLTIVLMFAGLRQRLRDTQVK